MRQFLIKLAVTITRKPRYFPDIKWSSESWTHNVFRAIEYFFGAPYTPKPQLSSAASSDGKVYYWCHSIESAFALTESYIRNFLSSWKLVPFRIYIPVFSTPQGIPVLASPYLFAIAWDANSTGSVNTTSLTVSHVCTGSNLVFTTWIELSGANTYTGATYNTVALSNVTGPTQGAAGLSGNWYSYQYLIAPATGTHNAVFSSSVSHFITVFNVTYSGCNQSSFPDSSNVGGSTGTGFTASTTVVASNCWLSMGATNAINNFIAGTGAFLRNVSSIGVIDSNATVGTGSQSMAVSWTGGSGGYNFTIVSIAPAGGAVAVNSGFFFAASR